MMKRGERRTGWAVVWMVAALVACSDAAPGGGGATQGGEGGGTTTTVIAGELKDAVTPPLPTPQLSGFFEQGNFATLTVKTGPPEAPTQQPLSIKALSVKVEIVGRLARTEVTQIFHNHLSQQTEGTYAFTLPAGAAVSRLAMDVDGRLMEGELVEREKARQIFEQIVRQQKDPALLEWQGGERFQTQVFPIPAQGDKTVVLTYEQLLPQRGGAVDYRYSLPNLSGQPTGSLIGAFRFEVTAEDAGALAQTSYTLQQDGQGGRVHGTLAEDNFWPKGAVELRFQRPQVEAATVRYAQKDGERFFLLDLVPELPAENQARAQDLVIVLDTSAGIGAVELKRSVEAAQGLIDRLPPGARYQVVHGDLVASACASAPLAAGDPAGRACLAKLDAGGATDLGGLLKAGVDAARTLQSPGGVAVVVFTDGVASIGELDGELLRAGLLKAIGDAPISLHAVGVGHGPDMEWLGATASAAQGHAVRMTPADRPESIVAAVSELIHEPLLTHIEVKALSGTIEGLTPHQPVNLARGQALPIMGRLDGGQATLQVSGRFRGQPLQWTWQLDASQLEGSPNRLLTNFWARAVIEEMQRASIHRDRIVQTSLRYGVMSRYTSFLVLENDEAYKRFQVERRKEAERKREAELQQAEVAAAQNQEVQNLKKSDANLQEVLQNRAQANKDAPPPPAEPAKPSPRSAEGAAATAAPGAPPADGAADDERMADAKVARAPAEKAEEEAMPEPDAEPSAAATPRLRRETAQPNSGDIDGDGFDRVGGLGQVGTGGGRGLGTKGRGAGGGGLVGENRVEWRAEREKRKAPAKPGYGGRFSPWGRVIQALEPRKGTLSLEERARLIEAYTQEGRVADARAYYKASVSAQPAAQQAGWAWALLARPNTRLALSREFEEAALAQLKQEPSPAGVAADYVDFLSSRGRHSEIERVLGSAKLDPLTASRLLVNLAVQQGRGPVADRLIAAWRAGGRYTEGEIYQLLTTDPALKPHVTATLNAVSKALVTSGDSRPEVMDDWVATSVLLKQTGEVGAQVITRCTTPRDVDANACVTWLQGIAPEEPRARELLRERNKARIAKLHEARAQDIANPELIKQLVALLRESGEGLEAARRLSELVEFTPHDYRARVTYAVALSDDKLPEAACAQYAAAVQLNPTERDTFKTMMRLRRAFPERAAALRSCIVDGVSKLPVQRAVSVVLTWDDPEADVDLHIHEVGGEEVFYSHRESRNAGLLYYDITDGFGPEIYVLGSGPAGEYRLGLVYYRGSAPNLTGTLTILRNAGSPDETREERPFTLPYASTSQEHPAGVFRL